jgi:hypothetical protein
MEVWAVFGDRLPIPEQPIGLSVHGFRFGVLIDGKTFTPEQIFSDSST